MSPCKICRNMRYIFYNYKNGKKRRGIKRLDLGGYRLTGIVIKINKSME